MEKNGVDPGNNPTRYTDLAAEAAVRRGVSEGCTCLERDILSRKHSRGKGPGAGVCSGTIKGSRRSNRRSPDRQE